MGKYDAVLFDLDGTLLDTLEDLQNAVNYALAKYGLPLIDRETARRYIGNGVRNLLLKSVYGEAFVRHFTDVQAIPPELLRVEADMTEAVDGGQCFAMPLDAASFEEALFAFRDYYDHHNNDCTKPYPGILALLQQLQKEGISIGVVSNKYDAAVKQLCEAHFGAAVAVALGQRDGVPKKPAPDGVFEAMAALGAGSDRTVYVGDSEVDVRTARRAGIDSILVTWGFRSREELQNAGADHMAESAGELLRMIEERGE